MPASISSSTEVRSRRRRKTEHLRQLRDGKRPSQRAGDRCDLTRRIGHSGQALSHARADSVGKPVSGQRRTPGIDSDKLLESQTFEQLHEQEWVSAGLRGHADERLIGLSLHHVARHLRHCGFAERLEHEPLCTLVGQILDGAPKLPRALIRTHRDDPSDRQRGETRRQRPQRGCGAAVGPLHVVQEYQ